MPPTLALILRAHTTVVSAYEFVLASRSRGSTRGLEFALSVQAGWKETQALEVTGKDGGPVQFQIVHYSVSQDGKVKPDPVKTAKDVTPVKARKALNRK